MKNLNEQIAKILKFANTQKLKEEEYVKHNFKLGFLLLFFLLVHVAASVGTIYVPVYLAIVLILINAYSAYHYLILTVHEGAHNLVFVSKNRIVAKYIRKSMPALPVLAGFPFFTIYVVDHMTHHKYLSEKRDLQNTSDLNFRKLIFFYFRKGKKKGEYYFRHFIKNTNLFVYTLASILKLGHVYLLYVLGGVVGIVIGLVIPLGLGAFVNIVRNSVRHYDLYPNPKPLRSRSYTFWGSSILGPSGLNYHFEHHLVWSVPTYRLKNVYNFVEKNCSKELIQLVHYKKFRWKDFW